jgi:hypothetical protein
MAGKTPSPAPKTPTPAAGVPQTPSVELTPPASTNALAEYDYGDDAGAGFENQTMADRKLPMFIVLQSNSPQVVNSKGKLYAGMIMNTVTEEVTEELLLVWCTTDHVAIQYVPRDDGGGFRGRHPWDSKIVQAAIAKNDGKSIGKIPLPQPPDPKTGKPEPTHELVETFEIFAITYKETKVGDVKSAEITGFGVIPCASKKIAAYRDWNSKMLDFRVNGKEVPIFAHRVKMTTVSDTNKHGTFMIPVFTSAEGGDTLASSLMKKDDPRYIAAKKLREDVNKGMAKGAYETMTQEPGVDPEGPAPF